MEIIDNINHLLGENLKRTVKSNAKLKIAASCFSIYAYAALKRELEKIDSLEFIFTAPTFVPHEVSDKIKKNSPNYISLKPAGSAISTAANSRYILRTS